MFPQFCYFEGLCSISELEKGADSADTSVLFFSGAVLIFSLCTHKNCQFAQNGPTCMLICPILTKYAYGYADSLQIGH